MALLWIAGGVYTSFRYIRLEYNCASFLNGCPTSTTAQIERLSEELGLPRGLACIHPAVPVPMSLGLFRPRILLTDQSFTDDELRFLLLHEYTHLKHHDAWVKLLFLVLRCVLWWDLPVCRLYSEIDNMLEFRCDRAVTKGLGVRDRARYLMVLEKVAASQCSLVDDRFGFSVLAVFRRRTDEDILITRSIAVQKRKEPTLLISVLTVVVLVLVFMLSYLVVVQPVIWPDEPDVNDSITISPDNSYIVHNADDTYTLWVNGEYVYEIPASSLDSVPHNQLKIIEGSD